MCLQAWFNTKRSSLVSVRYFSPPTRLLSLWPSHPRARLESDLRANDSCGRIGNPFMIHADETWATQVRFLPVLQGSRGGPLPILFPSGLQFIRCLPAPSGKPGASSSCSRIIDAAASGICCRIRFGWLGRRMGGRECGLRGRAGLWIGWNLRFPDSDSWHRVFGDVLEAACS